MRVDVEVSQENEDRRVLVDEAGTAFCGGGRGIAELNSPGKRRRRKKLSARANRDEAINSYARIVRREPLVRRWFCSSRRCQL